MTTTTTKEQFYLDRFEKAVESYTRNARNTHSFDCEIYKDFAIVVWHQTIQTPSGTDRESFSAFIWKVGGIYDSLQSLGWHYQGCVTVLSGASNKDLATTLKRAKKKVDFYSKLYEVQSELQTLSNHHAPSTYGDTSAFNALVGDVVRINGFGATRYGKVVSTTGNRFVVAYMTPSNPHDVHYKILPLNYIYSKDRTNP